MSRQREITRQQVLLRVDDARRRALDAVQKCTEARTGEEYENALREGVKAAQDLETWSKVIPSL